MLWLNRAESQRLRHRSIWTVTYFSVFTQYVHDIFFDKVYAVFESFLNYLNGLYRCVRTNIASFDLKYFSNYSATSDHHLVQKAKSLTLVFGGAYQELFNKKKLTIQFWQSHSAFCTHPFYISKKNVRCLYNTRPRRCFTELTFSEA